MFFTFLNFTLLNASYHILTANPQTETVTGHMSQDKINKNLRMEAYKALETLESYSIHETNIYESTSLSEFKRAIHQLFESKTTLEEKNQLTADIQTIGAKLEKETDKFYMFSKEAKDCVQTILELVEQFK